MFNSDIIKKIKKDVSMSKSLKDTAKEASKIMMPEEDEDEGEESEMEEESKKGSSPEAKIEIELMIQGAKKKKGK
jgi:hypothetical protein